MTSGVLSANVDGTSISNAGDTLSVIPGGIAHSALSGTHNLTTDIDHGSISGLGDSADHTWATLVNGTRAFTNTVSGVTPTDNAHLTTKLYVDGLGSSISGAILSYVSANYIDNSEMTVISGDIMNHVENDFISNSEMTVISGDILSYVSNNYIDNSEMTVISGDIMNHVENDFISNSEMTVISGDILSYVSNNYIDNSEMTVISGDILSYVSNNYIDNSEMTVISGDIIAYADLKDIWEVVDTPTIQIRPKAAHMGKAIYTSGNVTIGGDLTVTGTLFYTDTEIVQVSDNTIIVNYGESGAGVTKRYAGLEVDRGSEVDYWLVFDENSDNFRIGVSGVQSSFNLYPLQPVATREDAPIDTRVAWWDAPNYTFRTQGDSYITINSGTDTVVIGVNNVTEVTVTSGGLALKTGGDVNEILDSSDAPLTPSNTDDQLVTAKLMYDFINTVSGSISGSISAVDHNDLNGLQGGDISNRWHLNSTAYTALSGTDGTDISNWDAFINSTWDTTTNNSANWDTAYSWGNHTGGGYYVLVTHTLHNVNDGVSYERVAANQLNSGIYINATDSVKGIASFSTDNFLVTSGVVTIKDEGVNEAELLINNSPVDGRFLQYTSASGMQWTDVTVSGVTESDFRLENESVECNGTETAFTLDVTPISNSLQVYLNGLLQEKGSGKDYTHTGTTVTFVVAPLTGDILLINYVKQS